MLDELPLVHTSRSEHLLSVASTHTLNTRPCSVYGESLLYMFYGRPAYRSNAGRDPGSPTTLCPACFVFKPNTCAQHIKRILVCDSGGVVDNFFKPELSKSDLVDLELAPHINSARKTAHLFFNSNRQYFFGNAINGRIFNAGSIEHRFYQLLCRQGVTLFDDRRSTIEIQLDRLVLLHNKLLCIILPREFLDKNIIRNAIMYQWRCDALPYDTHSATSPSEYYSVIRHIAQEYLEKAGYI